MAGVLAVAAAAVGFARLGAERRAPLFEGAWDGPLIEGPLPVDQGGGLVPGVEQFQGADHCGWERATMVAVDAAVLRRAGVTPPVPWPMLIYVRNPEDGPVPTEGESLARAKLPKDAVDTGYRRGKARLFVAPSDAGRYVYVREGGSTSRWARHVGACV